MNNITLILIIWGVATVLSIHNATFTKEKSDRIIAIFITSIFLLLVLFNN